jgi:hypothetical protein
MKAAGFRKIALGLKDTAEGTHMGHPDFRVNGKVFATLHHDMVWGMTALTPEQQHEFVHEHPKIFVPENGAWGRAGYTKVHLAAVDEDTLGRALTLARQNIIDKNSGKPSAKKKTSKATSKRLI